VGADGLRFLMQFPVLSTDMKIIPLEWLGLRLHALLAMVI